MRAGRFTPAPRLAGRVAQLRAAECLRTAGATFGRWPTLEGRRLQLRVDGSMSVGRGLVLRARQFPIQITVAGGGRLTIGESVFINQGVNVFAGDNVSIGSHTVVADLAVIRDTNFHPVSPDRPVSSGPITIAENVWIGHGALISPGVSIGSHAVVAAHAVVTADVAPCTVVAGTPAAVVRTFDAPADWVRI